MALPRDVGAFVREWQDAWNAHDVERLLAHFAHDVTFSSPVAARMLPETGGVIHGRDELRRYWSLGLDLIPDLQFEVVSFSTGVDAVVITYRNHRGAVVNEVLIFDDGPGVPVVVAGYGTYLSPP